MYTCWTSTPSVHGESSVRGDAHGQTYRLLPIILDWYPDPPHKLSSDKVFLCSLVHVTWIVCWNQVWDSVRFEHVSKGLTEVFQKTCVLQIHVKITILVLWWICLHGHLKVCLYSQSRPLSVPQFALPLLHRLVSRCLVNTGLTAGVSR